MSTSNFDVSSDALSLEDLGPQVSARRHKEHLSLRDAATQIGISFNTLARIEAGHIPDLEIFRRVIDWLGVPITAFFSGSSIRTIDTPEAIAKHLRADPALSPDAANRISGIVRDLYTALAQPAGTAAFHLRAARTFKPTAAQTLASILEDIDQAIGAEST